MHAMQIQEAAMWLQRQKDLNWGAFPLTGVFGTTDGAVVLVGAFKANPLQDICKALDLPDLSQEPRFASFADKVAHKPELQRLFRERFATNTTEYWLGRLEEQDLLCAPVLTLPQALGHGQTEVNGSIIELDGGIPVLGSPLTMDESAFKVRHSPPDLGGDGRTVLEEAGYSAEQIDRLVESGALAGERREAAA
jgi:formyl-CoA transferase